MGVTRDRMRTIAQVRMQDIVVAQSEDAYEEKEGGEETGLLFSGTVAAEDASL